MTPFRKTRGQRSRFRPTVEGLEDRTVPAGNVTALMSGGNLFIAGDADGNALKVQGNSRGTIDLISMDANTIINSQPGMVTFVGFSGGIYVTMGDGFDALQIDQATIRGNLSVDMGDGDDMLVLTTTTVAGVMDIKTGEGNDRVAFGNTKAGGTVFVNIGNGDNQVNLLGVQFAKDSYFAAGVGTTSMGTVDVKFNSSPGMQNIGQRARAALPLAADDTATVAQGGTVSINVVANDVPIHGTIVKPNMVITQLPANGTAVVNGDGTISYTHNGSATTSDSFSYIVQNSKGGVSNPGKVAIAVTGVTNTTPTVNLTTTVTSPTRTNPIPFTATFSQDVTAFTQAGLVVTNGTVANFVATNAKVYTFNVIPTGQGAVTVKVAAGAGKNSGNIGNTESATTSITFDSTVPTVAVNPLVTNDTTPTVTGTVSESTATVKVTVNGQVVDATVSGTTWSATFATALAAGTYSVNAVATDPAGNAGTANSGSGLIIDLTPATVSITSTQVSTTPGPFPISVLFSKDMNNFIASDIVVTNGTLSNFIAVNDKNYTATVTPTNPGTVLVNIAANVATDDAGNGNAAAAAFSLVFANAGIPTVALSTAVSNPTSAASFPFTATFSESVNGFSQTDITVTNAAVSNFVAVNGTTYTFTVTPNAQGAVTVLVPANVATDGETNANLASLTTTITFDTTAPTVAISSTATSPTSGAFPISVVFSESVTGVVAADIAVTNGTLSNFAQVSPSTYTATVTPASAGTVLVNVAAGAAADTANNTSVAAPAFSIQFTSNGAPTVVNTLANITRADSAANTTLLLPGTFTDAAIGNSTVTFNVLKGATPFAINLELFDRDAPLTVANFLNYLDRYDDNGGTLFHRLNLQTALNVLQGGGFTFNSATNTINPHIAADAPIRNEFSAAHPNVRGTISMAKLGGDPNSATSEFFFNLDDANANTLGSSNNGGFTVFGRVVGAADLTVLDDLASVPIRNTGGFSQLPLVDGNTVDVNNILRIQSVTITHRDDQLSYSVSSSNPAVVSAALSGFQNNQLALDYLTAGTSTISVTATNKLGLSATTTFTVTVTGVVPTLTVTQNPSVTNDQTPTLTGTVSNPTAEVKVDVNGQTLTATVTGNTWSAPIAFSLTAGTYPIVVRATTPASGTVTVTNPTGLIVDLTAPVPTITTTPNPTGSATIPITVTFPEDIDGFVASDISVSFGTLSNFVTTNARTYKATVTASGDGIANISIDAGVANDVAGNVNSAASLGVIVDLNTPAVAITSINSNPTSSTTVPIQVQFTESVFGFEEADIVVTGGTLSNFITVNGRTFTATVTAAGEGPVNVTVAAGVAVDRVGKSNLAGSFATVVDLTHPTTTITSSETSPTTSLTIPIEVAFSESVNGFTAADIVVTGGTLGALTTVNGSTYTAIVTANGVGTVTVTVAADAASETAGNGNLPGTFSIDVVS